MQMKIKTIPQGVKASVLKAVAEFNHETFGDWEIAYIARFQGLYVYLDRKAFSFNTCRICRLKFNGNPDDWEFAIFLYSTGEYSTDEPYFPGDDEVDGTVEGALRAGMKAYPV